VHKLIEVDGLGVYWNSQGDLHEKRRRRSAREQPPGEGELPPQEYAYLMRPVDVKIKLAVSSSLLSLSLFFLGVCACYVLVASLSIAQECEYLWEYLLADGELLWRSKPT
jgi:hypothetical protein